MRIYLDCCCLQRPLDNQSQLRVRVETEAVFAILAAVQSRDLVLLNSEVLIYEISRIPDETRRTDALAVLGLASEFLKLDDAITSLAQSFEAKGLQAMDALHLATASVAKADFFCTCDDQLLGKAQALPKLDCKVSSLLHLIAEITL